MIIFFDKAWVLPYVIDEALVLGKKVYYCIDRLMRGVTGVDSLFGGVVMVLMLFSC